jgi:hypothetical protein
VHTLVHPFVAGGDTIDIKKRRKTTGHLVRKNSKFIYNEKFFNHKLKLKVEIKRGGTKNFILNKHQLQRTILESKMSHNPRTEFLRACKLPTQSQVRESLGNPLAEIFFTYVDDRLKKPFGLEPIMEGVTSESLWLSPSDILIGKVMMTPPMPTRRVVRALTHEGILGIPI